MPQAWVRPVYWKTMKPLMAQAMKPPPVQVNIVATTAPLNVTAPYASATSLATGGVCSCTMGTWLSAGGATYAYQWTRDGANIAGATNNSYTLVAADSTHAIACKVAVTNSFGTGASVSNTLSATVLASRGAKADEDDEDDEPVKHRQPPPPPPSHQPPARGHR
jgi:hypothetical protein